MQISSDELHGNSSNEITANAVRAANESGVDCGNIKVTVPCRGSFANTGDVLFKGRAALKLAEGINTLPWDSLTSCNEENLVNPSRLHIDQFGHAHICQGLVLGNLNKTTLRQLVDAYDHKAHPIISLVERGGPALLAEKLGAHHGDRYVDQCQLCYLVRKELSKSFPDHLAPESLYSSN